MSLLTQPLREEHDRLVPDIVGIRMVADMVGEVSLPVLRVALGDVYEFLTNRLLPHAMAEDRVVYPAVGKLIGAPQATATMRREHVEVARLAEELEAIRMELDGPVITSLQERALRRVLYGLYALLRAHLAEEDDVYLPILETGLSQEEAREMFEAMHDGPR